ncbi:Baseplate J-like protein [compost metagenome]
MPFTAPRFDAIRDAILRDIRNQLPDADIGSDSDNYVRAAGVAAAIEGIYQHQGWLYRQIWPDTADRDELLHHAANRGMTLKPAVAAGGFAIFRGTVGTTIPAGTTLRHVASGVLLQTTQTVVRSGLWTRVPVVAVEPGSAANGLSGPCTLTSPPLGILSSAELETLSGGVDAESEEQLLARLLDLMQNPPAGGDRHDYRRWAMSVPGVSLAIVLPKRRGIGTVDVVIASAGGLPTEATLQAVRDYLDETGPVGADWIVYGPQIVSVDISARLRLAPGYALPYVRSLALTELQALFDRLLPGQVLYSSQIEAVLSGLAGVLDRELITPADTTSGATGGIAWVRLGNLTLELMP